MLILLAILEMDCGIFILCGFFTRVAAISLIVDNLITIITMQTPILLMSGFWTMAYRVCMDSLMLLGLIFLGIVGAGPWSIDAKIIKITAKKE